MRHAIAIALEKARYPERFYSNGERARFDGTRPILSINNRRHMLQAPHPDEETRLSAVLSVLVTLRETEIEIVKAATEIAETMKGNR